MNIESILNRTLLGVGLLMLSWGVQAQIVGSTHDLSSGGTAQGTGTTDQVCIYCHTPHASDTAAPVPLWNKALPSGAGYTRYSTLQTASFDSTEHTDVGSVSLACLSCHDGGQSMDVVVNMPGSGQGALPRQIDGGTRTMSNTGGEFVPMLGTDLTNDHPVSMQYAGGGIDTVSHDVSLGLSQSTAALGDPDFIQPWGDTVNTNPVWWVNTTGGANTREKTDMLLYTRIITTNPEPLVECGSCHDPHNASTADVDQVAFLRIDNAASAVCTACHVK